MKRLESHKTWTLVNAKDVPEGEVVIGSRWVLSKKRDTSGEQTIHTAWVVGKGFMEPPVSQITSKTLSTISFRKYSIFTSSCRARPTFPSELTIVTTALLST